MEIPKSFKLFGTTYSIVWDDKRANEIGAYGKISYTASEILLSESFGGVSLSDDQKANTFYHERVHAILYEMGESELNENEKFVDIFAKLWKQSEDTAVYKKK